MKVKVRGIYSNAVSRFLQDSGVEIAEDNPASKSGEDSGTVVYDSEDLNGLTVQGENSEKIAELFKSSFFDIIVRKKEMGAIYVGEVVDVQGSDTLLDLGNGKKGILFRSCYRRGTKVLVQVKGRSKNGYILSTSLRLFGDSLVLIQDGFTKVSKHVFDLKEREKLLEISNEIDLRGYGILWKSLAQGKSQDELKNEINSLLKKELDLRKMCSAEQGPGLVENGITIYSIDFGLEAKQKLDKLRNDMHPTVKNHHLLKSAGYQNLVDFTEKLLVNNLDVLQHFSSFVVDLGPKENSFYTIVHKKPSGKEVLLKGRVEKILENGVVVRRKISPESNHDSIYSSSREKGDYILTTIINGEWFVTHEYYSAGGKLKARYYNINTGNEVMPRFSRYLDLEIDVVQEEGKEKTIIDWDKLKQVRDSRMVSEELYNRAVDIAKKLSGDTK